MNDFYDIMTMINKVKIWIVVLMYPWEAFLIKRRIN